MEISEREHRTLVRTQIEKVDLPSLEQRNQIEEDLLRGGRYA